MFRTAGLIAFSVIAVTVGALCFSTGRAEANQISNTICKQTAGQPSHCLNNPAAVKPPVATIPRPSSCRWYVSGARRVFLCSDVRLKRDVVQIGSLSNGIAVYRFKYLWSDRLYVGVLAQEVRGVMPDAVVSGPDGYLMVDYTKVGMSFMTWRQWTHARSAQPTDRSL